MLFDVGCSEGKFLLVVLLDRKLIRQTSSSSCLDQNESSREEKSALKSGNSSSLVFLE